MKQQEVVPNVITFTALISACEKDKRPEHGVYFYETMKQQGVLPNLATYHALMQVLAATGQVLAGFELLACEEGFGLLFHFEENLYPMFRILLEACRAAGEIESASQVRVMMERLGLQKRVVPVATTFVQGSEQHYENGMVGRGPAEAEQLRMALYRQAAYMVHLQALPW